MIPEERRLIRSTLAGLLAKSDAMRKSPADSAPIKSVAGWIYETCKLMLHHGQVLDELDRRIEGLEAAHVHQMSVIEDLYAERANGR